ncbi:MAG: HNH endonuclease [Pseudomonas sp.]|nr:HNH endonuclease [Pseudomonas sp.]MBP3935570.1 HNH endonuclease [Pseudomonas sp.]
MTNKPMLSVEREADPNVVSIYEKLAARVSYQDGVLVWSKTARTDLIGTTAGRLDRDGYRQIHLVSMMVSVHRLIYYMHTGSFPAVIDHIDGDTGNNKIENLRPATVSKNSMNCKISIANTSGVKGVSWHKTTGKWAAYVRINGRQAALGLHDHIFDAACARRSAEMTYYGEFVR